MLLRRQDNIHYTRYSEFFLAELPAAHLIVTSKDCPAVPVSVRVQRCVCVRRYVPFGLPVSVVMVLATLSLHVYVNRFPSKTVALRVVPRFVEVERLYLFVLQIVAFIHFIL